MNNFGFAVDRVLEVQKESKKPLGIVLAGRNGSGMSSLWRQRLAPKLHISLVNADRMMPSILPEPGRTGRLVSWAKTLRDADESWMRVAQKGVEAFVAQAVLNKAPFGMETVFSHWDVRSDGKVASKIDLIEQMQGAGYFVLLVFVGLSSSDLSIARVQTRVASGGHDVAIDKLRSRFARTQTAIRTATAVADATVLVDNSRDKTRAFSVFVVQLRDDKIYDLRQSTTAPPSAVRVWLDIVSPTGEPTRA